MTAPAKFIGRSVPRLEDRPLLTGQGRFAADISFPGQWTMRVVRSAVAHGRIKSIDAGAALALPGVHAVWTHRDVADLPPIPFRLTGLKELEPYQQPVRKGRLFVLRAIVSGNGPVAGAHPAGRRTRPDIEAAPPALA